MADKLSPLMIAALTRAAAEPAGVAVVALKGNAGLFPNTALARSAARRCLDEQLLKPVPTAENAGVERCAITERGLAWLVESQNPRAVIEDLVRVIEERSGQVTELIATATDMAANLRGLQATLAAFVPKVVTAKVPFDLALELISALAERPAAAGEDCPLPDLYRRLQSKPSLGAFHDGLRTLQRSGRVYLHPWTGPLYALPEPTFALLVGHEVAYYASVQRHENQLNHRGTETQRMQKQMI